MRYYFFLFFIFVTMLVMFFYNYGYAAFKYLKYDTVHFYSEDLKNKLSLRLLWSCKIGCGGCGYYVNLYPECEGSYVFVVDYYGVVKKLNFDTGKCVWSQKLSNNFCDIFSRNSNDVLLSGSVSVNKQRLYVGSELAKVYSLDVNNGAVLWVTEVVGSVISKPIISRGIVLVCTSNGVIQGLDAMNGIVKWSTSFEVPNFSFRVMLLPALNNDIVIIGDSSGIISACYIDTGQLIWQKKIFSVKGVTDIDKLSNIIAPIVLDGVIYAVAYNGNMVALDVISGDLIWAKSIGTLTNIIVEDNIIYLIDQDYRVVALNRINGGIVWSKSDLMYHQLISIVLYKDYIFLGDTKGYLYCLHKNDGSFLGKKKVAASYFNYLVIVCDKIIFYENNGNLSVWSLMNKV